MGRAREEEVECVILKNAYFTIPRCIAVGNSCVKLLLLSLPTLVQHFLKHKEKTGERKQKERERGEWKLYKVFCINNNTLFCLPAHTVDR